VFPLLSTWRAHCAAACLAALLAVSLTAGPGVAQDGGTAARVGKLEAEIANLKIMVATLVSLVRATPPSALESGPPMSAPPSDLEPRLGALEAKNGALANELAQISGQIERLAAKLEAAPVTAPPAPQEDLSPRLGALETQAGALADRLTQIGDEMKGLAAKVETAPEAPPPAPQQTLDPRLGQLETKTGALGEQLAQLGEQMKALEAKVEAAPKAAAPAEDDLKPRLGKLETETEALGKQVARIGAQMKGLEAKLDAAPKAPAPAAHAVPPEEPVAEEPPALAATPAPPPAPPTQNVDPRARWYGPKPVEDDGSPKFISPDDATGALPGDMPQSLAALPDENAQALYEQGYGDYLQQDYAAAEASFGKLVKRYPNDPLAGSAQYWIGETQYIRKQYQKAADSFLVGYRKYSSSDKAPDILLRLGMSLAALGETEAACNSFKELNETFPDAPGDLRRQVKSEAGKAGC